VLLIDQMPLNSVLEELTSMITWLLLEQIKDVCIVESGPHLDSKHAYVIVRHVKFATKKGGKKASQAIEDAGKGTRNTVSESPVDSDNKDEPIESGSEAGDRTISAQKGGKDQGSKRELNHSIANPGADREKLHNMNSGGSRASPGQERGETNRYAARRPPIRGNDQGFGQGRYPQDRRRDENEGCHAIHDNQRPLEQQNRSVPRFNQGRLPQDPRNKRRGHLPLTNNQRHPPGGDSGGPTATTKNFGMFSTPKPEPRKENDASASKSANTESPKSYGIFSSKK
jgi:translation initiation factor IF-3